MSTTNDSPPSPTTEGAKQAAISCAGIGKVWGEGTSRALTALTDIDLEVEQNEFLVLLGPSGCGKSTLLYLIAGLEEPSTGVIHSHGDPVAGPDSDRSLIFQESSLFPWLSVADNVAFGLKLKGLPKAERQERALHVLSQVGLADVIDKRPDELSGGMRQRAAVARALAMEPSALLMDEPFAALDIQTRNKMQSFLAEVWKQSGASVVFVTHHIDEALALADRVVVFTARPGRIKTIVPIDVERPRDLRDPRLHSIRDELVSVLADEVDRAFAEQEKRA